MFRNGLSAGCRSVRVPAIIPNLTTSQSSLVGPLVLANRQIPFICLSCQIRAYALKPRKTQSPLVNAIKRLERHVQFLERRYKDHLKREAVAAETPTMEITEEMQDQAYKMLMGQQTIGTTILPLPSPLLPRLPEPIVARLGTSLAVVSSEERPDWEPILESIHQNEGFKGLEIKDINKTIFLIPTEQRFQLTDKILAILEESEVLPTTFTYDMLMMAAAEMENVEKVQSLFQEVKAKGLQLTSRIYGHLMKAYSQIGDVAAASAAFQDMHAANIKPNLVVYTSLIKTCVKREELDTAWQIFELIKYRSTETAPDVATFGLMIHACALRGEAERALDLFRYMTENRRLEPDEKIYNTLIHTCAVRKDYFLDAWKYAIEMRNKGMRVGIWTLNLLLQACGKAGDLTRARLLVRLMMSAGSVEYQPDERSFQHLLRAYATARIQRGSNTNPQDVFFLGPHPNGTNGTHITKEALDKLPFLKIAVLEFRRQILREARAVVDYIAREKPEFYSTRILNAYLDVCLTQHGNNEVSKVYLEYYSSPKTPIVDYLQEESNYRGVKGQPHEDTCSAPSPASPSTTTGFATETTTGASTEATAEARTEDAVEPMVEATAEHTITESTTEAVTGVTVETTSKPTAEVMIETTTKAPVEATPEVMAVAKGNPSTNQKLEQKQPKRSDRQKKSEGPSVSRPEPLELIPNKPPRNLWTFESALEYARKQRNVKLARIIWKHRMEFCKTAEYWNLLHSIRRRLDFTAESLMLHILAKGGHLDEALQRLEVLQHQYEWTKKDLKILYDTAIRLENMDAVRTLRRVLKLEDRVW